MVAGFGARLPGAALVVIPSTTDSRGEGSEWSPSPIIAAESKLTTEAARGRPHFRFMRSLRLIEAACAKSKHNKIGGRGGAPPGAVATGAAPILLVLI